MKNINSLVTRWQKRRQDRRVSDPNGVAPFSVANRRGLIAGAAAIAAYSALSSAVSAGASLPPVRAAPFPQTVVALGSSNMSGRGATGWVADPTAANSYASVPTCTVGLITTALQAVDPDWRVYNRSISGSSTADSIKRFWTDVYPHHPSHVILGTSIANEPLFSSNPLAAIKVYRDNIRRLIQMVQSIGAVPILTSPYPFNGFTPTSFAAVMDCLVQLEQSGVAIVDYMSAMADTSIGSYGNFRVGGYDVDGTHVNDAGHAVYFDAWDLSIFTSAYLGVGTPDVGKGAWKITALSSGIVIDIPVGCRSFAMRCRILGAPNADGSATQMAAHNYGNANAPTRLRNNAPYNLTDGPGSASVSSTIDPIQDPSAHEPAFAYNDVTKKGQLFIDGAQIGPDLTVSQTGIQPCTRFAFGFRPDTGGGVSRNLTFSDLCVWRSPMQAADFAAMFNSGRIPTRSLIVRSRLNHPPRQSLTNMALTNIAPVLSGTWAQAAPF